MAATRKIPFVFNLIADESGTDLKQMFRVFNMGTRLEIYTDPENAKTMIELANSYNIDAGIIGHVEQAEQREVVIQHGGEEFRYTE